MYYYLRNLWRRHEISYWVFILIYVLRKDKKKKYYFLVPIGVNKLKMDFFILFFSFVLGKRYIFSYLLSVSNQKIQVRTIRFDSIQFLAVHTSIK